MGSSPMAMNPNALGIGKFAMPSSAGSGGMGLSGSPFSGSGLSGFGGMPSFGLPGLGAQSANSGSPFGSMGSLGLPGDVMTMMTSITMAMIPIMSMITQVLMGILNGSISSKAPEGSSSSSSMPAAVTSAGETSTSGSESSDGGKKSDNMTPVKGDPGPANASGFISPLKKGTYTLGDGIGAGRDHTGQDMATNGKSPPIMAAKDGVIEKVIDLGDSSYGKYIVIKHPDGTKTLYAHMSQFGQFKEGDKVSQGDIIGLVGSTGNSTGNHLHFEIFNKDGSRAEPSKVAPL